MHPSTRIQRRRASVSAYLRESAIFSVERLSHMTEDDLKVCFEGVTLPSIQEAAAAAAARLG